MQALLEFAPLLAFIITYYLGGLYAATGVLMAAMLLLLAVDYLLQRRIPPMHALSAGRELEAVSSKMLNLHGAAGMRVDLDWGAQ